MNSNIQILSCFMMILCVQTNIHFFSDSFWWINNLDTLNLDADLSKVKTEVKVEQNIHEDVLQQPKKKKKKKDKKSEA